MSENEISMADKMKVMGITFNSAKMYIVKHLNRQHKVRMEIPIWTGHEWSYNRIMWINEAPKGREIDKEYLIKVGCKPEDMIGKKFTIAYNLVDANTRQNLQSGFCETRDDIWEKYCSLISDAYNHYMVMSGKPIIEEVRL